MKNIIIIKIAKAKILDALQGEIKKSIVRIDPGLIRELGLKRGDILKIYNPRTQKKTSALLWGPTNAKIDSNSIRLGSDLRRNIDASLEDVVEISKIQADLAIQVSFAVLNKGIELSKADNLARVLKRRIITEKDIFTLSSKGKELDIIVINHTPLGEAVIIHEDTKTFCQKRRYKQINGWK